jgi:putative transposase
LPRLAPKSLHLSETERNELQQLVNRHGTPQQIAKRARIILLADNGQNHRQIARELDIGRDMARSWRNRWLELVDRELPVIERLQDAERSGAPATFRMEQVVELFALACSDPSNYGRAISHWTERELADEMVKQRLVESISSRHIGRLLEEAQLKPHQIRYWLTPPRTKNLTPKSATLLNFT